MTREEKQKAIDVLKISAPLRVLTQEEFNDYIQILNKIMNWLEQEHCENAISRQAVLDIVDSYSESQSNVEDVTQDIISDIVVLPSVNPQPKTGHWEWVQYDSNPNIGNWHCSECNRIVCGAITAVNPVYSYKYCPKCGAKMQEVEE